MAFVSDFDVPRYGDDGLLPDSRGWWSIPLTVSLWSMIFTIVYFSTRKLEIEDSVTADGYIGVLLMVFITVIFGVIPAITITLGRIVDDASKHLPALRVAVTFGLIGLILGFIPAIFIHALDSGFGYLPYTQFLIPSATTGFLSRFLVDRVANNHRLRGMMLGMTIMIVVGCLGIGVAVFKGAI